MVIVLCKLIQCYKVNPVRWIRILYVGSISSRFMEHKLGYPPTVWTFPYHSFGYNIYHFLKCTSWIVKQESKSGVSFHTALLIQEVHKLKLVLQFIIIFRLYKSYAKSTLFPNLLGSLKHLVLKLKLPVVRKFVLRVVLTDIRSNSKKDLQRLPLKDALGWAWKCWLAKAARERLRWLERVYFS